MIADYSVHLGYNGQIGVSGTVSRGVSIGPNMTINHTDNAAFGSGFTSLQASEMSFTTGTAGPAFFSLNSPDGSNVLRQLCSLQGYFVSATTGSYRTGLKIFVNDHAAAAGAGPAAREAIRIESKSSLPFVGVGGAVSTTAMLNVNGDEQARHLGGNSGTPSITLGNAAGTTGSPVYSNSGNDLNGKVAVTTGTGMTGTAGLPIFTMTFATAYNVAPEVLVLIHDAGLVAAGIPTRDLYWDTTTTTFALKCKQDLPATTTFTVTYHVFGN